MSTPPPAPKSQPAAPDAAARLRAAAPRLGLCAASATLLWLAFPPVGAWPLAFVALVPWLWALRGCELRAAFGYSTFFGTVLSALLFSFLLMVSNYHAAVGPALPVLFLVLGAHIGLVGMLSVWFGRELPPAAAFVLSVAAWVAVEWFRSVGRLSLPMGMLAHPLIEWPAFAQVAGIGGVPLAGGIVFAVNLALMTLAASAVKKRGLFDALVLGGATAAVLFGAVLWGGSARGRAYARLDERSATVRVALVQTGVAQKEKFDSYSSPDEAARTELQNRHLLSLFKQIDSLERGQVDLVALPESVVAAPEFSLSAGLQREFIQRARDLDASIMLGALDLRLLDAEGNETTVPDDAMDGDGGFRSRFYNAIWLVTPGESEPRRNSDYQKAQLVPFGETIPYLDMIPGAVEGLVGIGTFDRADAPRLIALPLRRAVDAEGPAAVVLGPSVCFEDMVSWIARHEARGGAQLLVNATNDAWYDPFPGDRIHSLAARWRTVETRLPMIRATNTGLTESIDIAGTVLERLPPRDPAIARVSVRVPLEPARTLYARFGDWFAWLCVLAVLGGAGFLGRRPLE
ncbi:MAG: apolipoprotein N-acyltransferase [Candidatus Sumerlaeia bacterium]|nr:apolipoprotein N-acyltransferase [Candidatus Sumerlaeia bacterium]